MTDDRSAQNRAFGVDPRHRSPTERTKLAGACGIAVALLVTFRAHPASAQFSSTATVSSTSLPAGSPLTVDARVTNAGAPVAGGHIQIFLRNKATSAGQAVQNCDTTLAGSGASTSCRQVFDSLPTGTYGVEIGVFDAGWTSNLHWNGSSSLPVVTVTAPPPFTSSATVSATTIPTSGSVAVSARVVNNGADIPGGHVQIFLRNTSTNTGQSSQNCDVDILGSGAATTCNKTFAGLPVGSYAVELGVFTSTWANPHWNAGPPLPTVIVVAGSADVTVAVDTSRNRRAISPYVYGANSASVAPPPGTTFLRAGGNRWTAYNWASNYSNAGTDFGPFSNDTHMGSPANGPGFPAVTLIGNAKAGAMAGLITIPIQGWVSKDASGPVPITGPLTDHFIPNLPRKGSAFTTAPSPNSTTVYQDEFANFIAQTWGPGHTTHVALDNEADLWAETHAEVQRSQLTYANVFSQSVASASAIRDAVPGALIYGPASYGWGGYVNLQGAPDAPPNTSIDNSFLDAYLQRMNAESATRHTRLLDLLDLHYYTEATGCGTRVTFGSGNTDCIVAARVQAPRSLADPTYVETSWITQNTQGSAFGQAIQLIPRMMAKIAAGYPGTRLAITEYDFGGTAHISGALAEADALGIFGREGVYAAALWRPAGDAWIFAAWRAYRNYDGAGHNFGDTAALASSSDLDHVSAFASVDAASSARVVLVLVHRPTLAGSALDLRSRTVSIQLTHSQTLATVRAWQLTAGASPTSPWPSIAVSAPTNNSVTLTLPRESITTIELTP